MTTEAPAAPATVDTVVYGPDGRRVEFSGDPVAALTKAREVGGFCWVGLHEPDRPLLDEMAEAFTLHPLAVEDALNAAAQRPKVDVFDDLSFLVLKTAHYLPHEKLTSTSDIVCIGVVLIFTGPNFLISIRHGDHGELGDIRERLENNPDLLRAGPGAVLHAVADSVVDDYLRVANAVEADVDDVETAVFSTDRGAHVERIYQLKREVLRLKRAVTPTVEPIHLITERAKRGPHADLGAYFGDVEDHLIRVRDQIAAYDELLTSILQANLTQITVEQGEDMRRISAWVAIVAVPTAIAAIYGMNFNHMPELRYRYGYPLVLLAIAVICGALYRGFRRSGWL